MAVEFRGCKGLVYAKITADTAEAYTTGEVKALAPVAEISKTTGSDSATSYYDNVAANVIASESSDEVSFTIAIPSDEVLAEVTGRVYDSEKKMFIEAPRTHDYFAVGYVLGEIGDDGDERYVWRYKGKFGLPDETAATENDGTDVNNMTLVFTGVYTTHEFTNGGGTGVKAPAKSAFKRKSDGVTQAKFFAQVTTPDTANT